MRKKTAIQVFVPLVIAITALTSCKGGSNAINSRIPIVAATAAAIHNVDTSAVASDSVAILQEDTIIVEPGLAIADTARLVASHDSFFEGPYKIQPFFGYNAQYGNNGENDVPKIPSLVFMSTGTRHFGIRCPSKSTIRLWVAGRVADFVCQSIKGNEYDGRCFVPTYTKAHNAKEISSYYYDILCRDAKPVYRTSGGKKSADQSGYLLVDVWNTPYFTTMQEAKWSDISGQNAIALRSWYTVSRKTGIPMRLEDIVADKDRKIVAEVVLRHLRSASGAWLDSHNPADPEYSDILAKLDGCALMPNCILFYFHPGKIGKVEEGQYNAMVPGKELKNGINLFNLTGK